MGAPFSTTLFVILHNFYASNLLLFIYYHRISLLSTVFSGYFNPGRMAVSACFLPIKLFETLVHREYAPNLRPPVIGIPLQKHRNLQMIPQITVLFDSIGAYKGKGRTFPIVPAQAANIFCDGISESLRSSKAAAPNPLLFILPDFGQEGVSAALGVQVQFHPLSEVIHLISVYHSSVISLRLFSVKPEAFFRIVGSKSIT